MFFRLVWFDTDSKNPRDAESQHRHEFLCNRQDAWVLWFTLVHSVGEGHVQVYDLAGNLQKPEEGVSGLVERSL